jgi:hypothetical protein
MQSLVSQLTLLMHESGSHCVALVNISGGHNALLLVNCSRMHRSRARHPYISIGRSLHCGHLHAAFNEALIKRKARHFVRMHLRSYRGAGRRGSAPSPSAPSSPARLHQILVWFPASSPTASIVLLLHARDVSPSLVNAASAISVGEIYVCLSSHLLRCAE